MAERIDGIALGSIAVGAALAYAGIKGKSVPSLIQGFVQGKPPASAAKASQISGTSTGSTSGGSTSGGSPGATPSGPGETAWFTALLVSVGALPTAANLASLHNWRTRESPWNAQPPDGAQFTHNPLNTTLRTSGSTGSVNSVGVQIYSSAAAGVAATAQTLLGGYPAIVSALRHGVGLALGGPAVAGELSKWSGGGYSSV